MTNAMERVLKLKNGNGTVDVVVAVCWPEQRQASWFSDWQIGWPDRKRNGSAGGVDAIQALICALTIVGTEVYCSDEHEAGRLKWGDDWLGYGFPVPNGIRDVLIGDDAKYL